MGRVQGLLLYALCKGLGLLGAIILFTSEVRDAYVGRIQSSYSIYVGLQRLCAYVYVCVYNYLQSGFGRVQGPAQPINPTPSRKPLGPEASGNSCKFRTKAGLVV